MFKGLKGKKEGNTSLKGMYRRKKKSKKKKSKGIEDEVKTTNSNDTIPTLKVEEKEETMLILKEQSKLLASFPSDDPKDTALHVACAGEYPDSLLLHLLKDDAFKDMLLKSNEHQRLPLHVCAMNKKEISNRLLENIIYGNSEALKQKDKDGNLPLHCACSAGVPSQKILQDLLDEYPDGCEVQSTVRLPIDCKALCALKNKSQKINFEEEQVDNDESSTNHNYWWDYMTNPMLEHWPPSQSSIEYTDLKSDTESTETMFTPLHLAILNHAPPQAVESILCASPKSILLKTDQGRTPLDCANFLLGFLYDTAEDSSKKAQLQNTFDSMFILKCNSTMIQRRQSLMDMSEMAMTRRSLESHEEKEKFDAKKQWRKSAKTFRMIRMFSKKTTTKSYLGPVFISDDSAYVCSEGFETPSTHDEIVTDVILPVGFRRLRWAMLSKKSELYDVAVLQEGQKCTEVICEPWSDFNEHIGKEYPDEGINEADFIGTTMKRQYIFPKSGFVKANLAYQTTTLTEYNDDCFVMDMLNTNPEVPYGKVIEAHVKYVFINQGQSNTRMICSVHCEFLGNPPMIAWKIKSAMFAGVTTSCVEMGESICACAGE